MAFASDLYDPWQLYQRQQLLAQNSIQTQAIVVPYTGREGVRGTRRISYQYTPTPSQTFTCTEHISFWPYHEPGQTITVHYAPLDLTIVAVVNNSVYIELFIRRSICMCTFSGLAVLMLILAFMKARRDDA